MIKKLYICCVLMIILIYCFAIKEEPFFDLAKVFSSNTAPLYVQNEAKRVSGLVRSVQNEHTFTILAVSDLHYWDGNETVSDSLNDMAQGVKAVLSQTHVDYKVAFGDYIYRVAGGYEDYQAGVNEMTVAVKILNDCFGKSTNQIRLTGNHDTNALQLDHGTLKKYFSMKDMYDYIGKYNKSMVKDSVNPLGNYGYIDIPGKKIRIICLNTSDFTDEGKPPSVPQNKDSNKNATTSYCMSKRQIEWFIETLKLNEIKEKTDWKIMLMSHMVMAQTSGKLWNNTGVNLGFILSEYRTKRKGIMKTKGVLIPYDYTEINPVEILPHIYGHNHAFPVRNINRAKVYKGVDRCDIVAVGLPNACPFRNGKSNAYMKTRNTVTSTAFSVIVIDLEKNIEYVYCYGAGFDRIIHYNVLHVLKPATLNTLLAGTITWESQNIKVATVLNGIVTPVARGNTMVIAKDSHGNCEYWNVEVK